MKILKICLALLLIFLPSKASAQILSKYQDDLYIENAPFNPLDKLSIEGIKKLKQFQTDNCGIALIKELNGESSPVDVLDLSSGQTQTFTIVGGMQDINKTPVCKNGVLQTTVNSGIFAVNDNVHETVYGFKLNPNAGYSIVFNGMIYKKITPNSCGFAKIPKPQNAINDSLLRINYLVFNPSSSFSTVMDDKRWNTLPEKIPPICLKNIKYIPYQ
ncbi:hypothetical protein [Nostoc sp. PA-18-2419]|uniref:hypothetical protein n=1 Tax=Nostoc sp. PA-18-2419 TaxID=2575443 RepID=UPI0011090878|nr:hypothetical protein [Nostoc sp. PA-18-2419]